MTRSFLLALLVCFAIFGLQVPGQETPTREDLHITEDGPPQRFKLPLPAPAEYTLDAYVTYAERVVIAASQAPDPSALGPLLNPNQRFFCRGTAEKGATEIILSCSADSAVGRHKGGWYDAISPIALTSPDGAGAGSVVSHKPPHAFLIASIPPPPPPTILFPKITGMPVVMLSEGEILSEADESADELYREFLSRRYGQNSDRAFLIDVAQHAVRILALTRRRYDDSSLATPGFVEEFEARFSALLKELGSKSAQSLSAPTLGGSGRFQLTSMQRASRTDSATVQAKSGRESKGLTDATTDITDFKHCLDQMRAAQNHLAKWTLHSTPAHAVVTGRGVFAKKSEPERTLGETNLEDMSLQRLTWVFRAKWADGCTRSITVNPYAGAPLIADFRKADGCEKP